MNSNHVDQRRAAGTSRPVGAAGRTVPARGSSPAAVRSAGASRPAPVLNRASGARASARPSNRSAAQAPSNGAARAGARPAARPASRPAALAGRGWLTDPDHRYSALRWALLAALVVYTLLVVRSTTARDVDFGEIASAMAAAPGIGNLEAIDANGFQDRLGIAPEDCEGWLLYGSGDIMHVSELMVVKAADDGARERFESACAARVEAQLNVFRSYGVDQKDLLEDAILWQRGSYVFYGVSENADAWEELFLSCIR